MVIASMTRRYCGRLILVAIAIGAGLLGSALPGRAAPPSHWAYQRPVDPPVPTLAGGERIGNPIDAFILAKLDEAGLKPAPRADRRTLVRRAYFDLIGLPPSPAQVDEFVSDDSPDAWPKLIDRLLADPHYGERWGRYWLDVARYADTKGYVFREERKFPFAYTYRDYVIRAFNDDKPYDQFLLEQIAADQLPLGQDKSPLAAMGFLTLGRRFINVLPDIIDDRLDVIFRGTQGVTIGCARCHNHKFDPVPTSDYYALYSIFNNSREMTDPPVIGKPADQAAYARFVHDVQVRQKELDDFIVQQRERMLPGLRSAEKVAQYLLASRGPNPDEGGYNAGVAPSPWLTERWRAYLRLKARQNDPVFALWRAYEEIPDSQFAQRGREVAPAMLARLDERPVNPYVLMAFMRRPPASMRDVAQRYGDLLARFDEAQKTNDPFAEMLRLSLRGPGAPTDISIESVVNLFTRELRERLTVLKNGVDAVKADNPGAPPQPVALQDAAVIAPQHVFVRGNPGNPGPEVRPHFLTALAGENPPIFHHGSGRLELAQAIACRDNPLTARVMVNRIWLHHFGFGLVRTPSDFGTRGDPPTHPQLLDYLALRFMDGGAAPSGKPWSIKDLHRLIMLSSTYQMKSDATPQAQLRDPQNLLLSHFNRQRLDFEATRDAMLAVSGRLDPTLYGRPVDIGDQVNGVRRTIYAFVDRQNLPGTFRSFDFASPDATCPRRFSTTVPQQALFMMNSPFVIGQCHHVVERREVQEAPGARDKINALYRVLLGRLPTDDEAALGLSYLQSEEQQKGEPIIWDYGTGQVDASTGRVTAFHRLPRWTPSNQWEGLAKVPAIVTATGGRPGGDEERIVIRRWNAMNGGVVLVSGRISLADPKGPGIHVRILSSRLGQLAEWNLDRGSVKTSLEEVNVKAGDSLDFVVESLGQPQRQAFEWPLTISAADGSRQWSAAAEFGGPDKFRRPMSPWVKYAQVLMESNEFVFVD